MLKKLFGHREKTVEVVAPVNGEIVDLKKVPDPVFAEKMMGEGLAIKPADGEVVSPVNGEVVQLFPTNHAVGLKTKSGVEVLIHIGLETVSMEGEGFTAHISQGDKVRAGDKLISFEKGLVEEKAKSTVTPIIITNSNDVNVEVKEETKAAAGTTVLMNVHSE
ncbi:PTS glucose transporter subunit IIA [Halobacillus andaensis]|uniref:PTS glucose transporter subunit IIA n=1 Tax=Halobacillus andaensis TaxID=1176239 RepID=A0A917EV38_HALAA|nr:PTS glucose transporter subunit IIA [Halobacillus andaensis]MBP2004571.1 PTS system glucose-specific IIA component [Halobacillus andaensis]GGF20639.1 PTS glucose transporter subunit IIA [Halobacillus andaensis]